MVRLRRPRDGETRELWTSLTARPHRVAALSWTPDPKVLAASTLRWPSRYGWEPAQIWGDQILAGMSPHVRVERVDIPQRHDGVISFEWNVGGRTHPVALGYGDDPQVEDAAAAAHALHFKMQHLRGGYPYDHVVPGGYVASRSRFYKLLPLVRRGLPDTSSGPDVYGRFSLVYASDVRRAAIEALQQQDRFEYEGGGRITGFLQSLRDAGRSRVCIDLPGNGPFCHRLVEYLALGRCIVALRHPTELHVPLEPDHHIAYADDTDELVDTCERLVRDDRARAAMGAAARDHFDRWLHRDQLGAYYLWQITTRLG